MAVVGAALDSAINERVVQHGAIPLRDALQLFGQVGDVPVPKPRKAIERGACGHSFRSNRHAVIGLADVRDFVMPAATKAEQSLMMAARKAKLIACHPRHVASKGAHDHVGVDLRPALHGFGVIEAIFEARNVWFETSGPHGRARCLLTIFDARAELGQSIEVQLEARSLLLPQVAIEVADVLRVGTEDGLLELWAEGGLQRRWGGSTAPEVDAGEDTVEGAAGVDLSRDGLALAGVTNDMSMIAAA